MDKIWYLLRYKSKKNLSPSNDLVFFLFLNFKANLSLKKNVSIFSHKVKCFGHPIETAKPIVSAFKVYAKLQVDQTIGAIYYRLP